MNQTIFSTYQFPKLRLFSSLLALSVISHCCLFAQPPAIPKPLAQVQADKAKPSKDDDTVQVVIKKNAIHLMKPEKFQAAISLKPIRSLEVRTKVSGIVQNIRVKPGGMVRAQEELVQIESKHAKMVLEHAKAVLKAANLRRELTAKEVAAGKQPQVALDLAEAEINVAKTELNLAQLEIENMSVRAVFSGQIKKVMTTQGAIVNQGDQLLQLIDTSQLVAHIPVDREKVSVGKTLEVKLDNKVAKGKVQAILPLEGKWQALRQIIDTAAIAVVIFDNQSKAYQDGQTAYSAIVPRLPVIEVPNMALKNSETGSRIIQVVRESMIRDIEVQLLGPLGEGRSYVTGPLQEKDELISESSQSLADGTLIRPAVILAEPAKRSSTPGGQAGPDRGDSPF